ncbi:hypothetical protein LINGRAHAP2_LOCUS2544 [Linum grandiflorum]
MLVTPEEMKAFHTMDRQLFVILTFGLLRDPMECMQIIAFWYWLGVLCSQQSELAYNILNLPWGLINEIADEAVTCLNCINSESFVYPSLPESIDGGRIPLTVSVLDEDCLTMPFFFSNRLDARERIAKEYNRMCIPALADLMHLAIEKNARQAAAAAAAAMQRASSSVAAGVQNIIGSMGNMTLRPPAPQRLHIYSNEQRNEQLEVENEEAEERGEEEAAANRIMFATFSKGYPVAQRELKEFLMRNFGPNCIESLRMQEVTPPKQSLYARIVFRHGSTMDMILDGMDKAKFNINGKHVWVRKFVPYRRPNRNNNNAAGARNN